METTSAAASLILFGNHFTAIAHIKGVDIVLLPPSSTSSELREVKIRAINSLMKLKSKKVKHIQSLRDCSPAISLSFSLNSGHLAVLVPLHSAIYIYTLSNAPFSASNGLSFVWFLSHKILLGTNIPSSPSFDAGNFIGNKLHSLKYEELTFNSCISLQYPWLLCLSNDKVELHNCESGQSTCAMPGLIIRICNNFEHNFLLKIVSSQVINASHNMSVFLHLHSL
jgi:hypothetical protein